MLDFEEDHGRLVATKLTTREAVDELFGVLEGKGETDTIAGTAVSHTPCDHGGRRAYYWTYSSPSGLRRPVARRAPR